MYPQPTMAMRTRAAYVFEEFPSGGFVQRLFWNGKLI